MGLFSTSLFLFLVASVLGNSDEGMEEHKKIYEFSVTGVDGKDVSLEKYRGHVVVVVNVASQCGYTDNHYQELKELHDKYFQQGFRVAAFPCNQFGSQEPDTEQEILKFVKNKYSYEPDIYAKVKVNGNEADPFWEWLKHEQGGTIVDTIKWNFTKFLVNRKGHVVKRYAPTTNPASLEQEIRQLLEEKP